MDYDNKLIITAKKSRCKICGEYISESEADNMEFQACKTNRGGVFICAYPVLAGREGGKTR